MSKSKAPPPYSCPYEEVLHHMQQRKSKRLSVWKSYGKQVLSTHTSKEDIYFVNEIFCVDSIGLVLLRQLEKGYIRHLILTPVIFSSNLQLAKKFRQVFLQYKCRLFFEHDSEYLTFGYKTGNTLHIYVYIVDYFKGENIDE